VVSSRLPPPDEIYNEPVDLRVAEFIGSPRINTLFSCVAPTGGLEIFGHLVPIDTRLPAGTKVIVAARPEAVNLTLDLRNEGIPGTVIFRENLGSEVLVNVGIDGSKQPVKVRLDPLSGRDVPIGSRVRLKLPLRRLLVFNDQRERVQTQPLSLSREYGAICG
ncbi:MAG: TOBE domain-containing protein, partial [Thermodesulfobacteriota bacterium]|nr:TOBE domain-containing protein [Thermodesulfobacteriota bacterium]